MSEKMEPIPARIVGGPIEMRGYDHMRLAVDHDAVLPDGSTVRLPAGSLLYMLVPGGHVEQFGGLASKNERTPIPHGGEA
ncbi:hypothetical protein [Sorangium sp. So ce388]|uniref:hypothetical protein n=1 Tax=Sorangium sp. So ce388 TaxID=3133309 RepID=UPI003F5BEE78